MKDQQGMYVHPAMMMVLVAAISIMLTVIVMNRPLANSAETSTTGTAIASAAVTGGIELYYSTMHPWIVQDHPGSCPICGMDLVKMPPDEQTKYLANHPELM